MPTSKLQARSAEIVVQELPDETLVYDLKNHKAHCLNRTASLVWKSCDGKRSAAEIARLLAKQSGGPPSEEVVWLALRQLSTNHLLAEKLTPPAVMAGVSRRELARKLGLAAVALPVVTSVMAPTAVQAATGVRTECACLYNGPIIQCATAADCTPAARSAACAAHCLNGIPNGVCPASC